MADIEVGKDIRVETKCVLKNSKIRCILKTVLHFACLSHHVGINVYGIVYMIGPLQKHEEQTVRDIVNLAPGFGTNWNLGFQTIFLTLSLFHDLLEWTNRSDGSFGSKIRYWRDIIFSSCAFPFTMFVTSMFWVVYAIDRELVFPKVFDEVVPWWFNHCVHTNIFFIVALETIVQPRTKPINRKIETTLCWTVSIVYAIVYYSIYFFTHRWLYRIFGVMTWWQVCLFQLLVWFSTYFFYLIQYPVNRLIHTDKDVNDKCLKDSKNQEDGQKEANGVLNEGSHGKLSNGNALELTKRIKVGDRNGISKSESNGH